MKCGEKGLYKGRRRLSKKQRMILNELFRKYFNEKAINRRMKHINADRMVHYHKHINRWSFSDKILTFY